MSSTARNGFVMIVIAEEGGLIRFLPRGHNNYHLSVPMPNARTSLFGYLSVISCFVASKTACPLVKQIAQTELAQKKRQNSQRNLQL